MVKIAYFIAVAVLIAVACLFYSRNDKERASGFVKRLIASLVPLAVSATLYIFKGLNPVASFITTSTLIYAVLALIALGKEKGDK